MLLCHLFCVFPELVYLRDPGASRPRHANLGESPADVELRVEAAGTGLTTVLQVIRWSLALAVPLGLGWLLRRRDAVWLGAALGWALLVIWVNPMSDTGGLALWGLYALGSTALALWGIRDQQRLAVNVGVLGFALAIFGFYFSALFAKLGRALGLIGAGAIFIGGGWLLERARRRLVGRIVKERA